jgi:hypothetical protein
MWTADGENDDDDDDDKDELPRKVLIHCKS